MDIRRIDPDMLTLLVPSPVHQQETTLVQPTVATPEAEDLDNERHPGELPPRKRSRKRPAPMTTSDEETELPPISATRYTPDGHVESLESGEHDRQIHSIDLQA